MNYTEFKIYWHRLMIIDENLDDADIAEVDEDINDHYTCYKEALQLQIDNKETVEEWFNFFFLEFSLNKHNYKLRSK